MAKKKTVKKVPRKKPEKRASIECPYCRHAFSIIDDTKPGDDEVTRYRKCLKCGKRFPTEERRKWK